MTLKKIIKWVCVLAMLLPGLVSAAQSNEPRLIIDEPVYLFEQVPEGSHVSHVFILKNTGDVPVRILKVQPP